VRTTSFRPIVLASVALAALVAGCGDDPVEPGDFFQFAEADAVMRSAEALPSLSEIALGASPAQPYQEATLVLARQLWAAGVAGEPAAGAAQRRTAVAYAAPVLTQLVPPAEWASIRVRTDEWTRMVETMLQHLTLPDVERRVVSARHHLERADAAAGDDSRYYHTLMALADLMETTPRFVARRLVADAELAVGRADAVHGADPEIPALARAKRLADWAARADEEEDHVRAIQRAYYALQLVKGL
jgi:hypothetical protein